MVVFKASHLVTLINVCDLRRGVSWQSLENFLCTCRIEQLEKRRLHVIQHPRRQFSLLHPRHFNVVADIYRSKFKHLLWTHENATCDLYLHNISRIKNASGEEKRVRFFPLSNSSVKWIKAFEASSFSVQLEQLRCSQMNRYRVRTPA